MATQGYKEIPKTVRTNWTGMLVYGIGNSKEVEAIWEEYNMKLDKKAWLEVYRYCTDDQYAFMYINGSKDQGKQIMKNFEEVITVSPEDTGVQEF